MKSISEIKIDTIEGRLLMAAIARLSSCLPKNTPDEILALLVDVQVEMFKDGTSIPGIKNTACDMLDRAAKQLQKDLTEYAKMNAHLLIDNIVNNTPLPEAVFEHVAKSKYEIQQIEQLSRKLFKVENYELTKL